MSNENKVVLPEPDAAISEVMGLVSDWGMASHCNGEAALDAHNPEATEDEIAYSAECQERERAAWLSIETKLRALLATAPLQPVEVPTKDQATWCSYIAGMIGCYLNEPDDSPRVKAIAGIIERRLWALPSAATATGLPAQAEGADSLKLLADIRSMAESTIKAGLVDDRELLHTFETIIKTAAKAKRPTCAICDSKGFIDFDDELARGRNGGRWGVCKTCSNTAPQAQADARDAGRYRFIVEKKLILSGGTEQFGWPIAPFGRECDRYIDAAIAAAKGDA